jgi:hypothetical protein
MGWKQVAVGVGISLLAIWLSNNVGFVKNIVGPKM